MTQEKEKVERKEIEKFQLQGKPVDVDIQAPQGNEEPLAVEFYDKPIDWNNGGS